MTHSLEPWSMSFNPNSKMATIKDAQGHVVGVFPDSSNAEYVIELLNKIVDLEREVEELECKFNVNPGITSLQQS